MAENGEQLEAIPTFYGYERTGLAAKGAGKSMKGGSWIEDGWSAQDCQSYYGSGGKGLGSLQFPDDLVDPRYPAILDVQDFEAPPERISAKDAELEVLKWTMASPQQAVP